ncbi:hypothetical protein, partial [Marinobacter subterrani]|uniref:hypothetical protein n=1 Tax=Marinobacter subterrani TaxID=1658765 RepID=UPI002356DCD7
ERWHGRAFQNCAEPWMAELKRHRDVPQGACFGKPFHAVAPPKLKAQTFNIKITDLNRKIPR